MWLSGACSHPCEGRIRCNFAGRERLGPGFGPDPGAAHERALKSAETDATKRALSTFGGQFDLNLYDREQTAVRPARPLLTLFAPDGKSLSDSLSPEDFSTGFRQLIDSCRNTEDIDGLARNNAIAIADLRIHAPALRNNQGTHFSDLLLRLMERARRRLSGAVPGATNFVNDGRGAEIKTFPVPEENFQRMPVRLTHGGHGGEAAISSISMRVTLDEGPSNPISVDKGRGICLVWEFRVPGANGAFELSGRRTAPVFSNR